MMKHVLWCWPTYSLPSVLETWLIHIEMNRLVWPLGTAEPLHSLSCSCPSSPTMCWQWHWGTFGCFYACIPGMSMQNYISRGWMKIGTWPIYDVEMCSVAGTKQLRKISSSGEWVQQCPIDENEPRKKLNAMHVPHYYYFIIVPRKTVSISPYLKEERCWLKRKHVVNQEVK